MENFDAPDVSTGNNKGILIDQIFYEYSLTKSEDGKDSLLIKLYDPNNISNFYFSYEASYQQLIKDIKFLAICEDLDEIIDSLKEIFSQGNVEVEEKDGEYNLEFKVVGIKKKCFIQLTKNEIEIPKVAKNDLEDKIDKLEKKYNDLLNKFERLKDIKENEIKDKIKEIIFDKDIKSKLFEEMEKLLLSKYNLNNTPKDKNEKENENENEKNLEDKIVEKVQNVVNNKEEKLNNQIVNLQKQIKDNIHYLNNLKLNNNNNNGNNYIILQVKIDKEHLNKEIRLFNQVSTYKYYSNFERDDIEVIIDDKIVPIKFKIDDMDFFYYKSIKDCKLSQKLEYYLSFNFYYYWEFKTTGIHTIKIIFKKKLSQCNGLFCGCGNIYKIDCSHFDCSQIIDCSQMFSYCSSLVEINLGKLDFALSSSFFGMFRYCPNLEKLDVSNLNTQNAKGFKEMFLGCKKLKEINVSNFKTKNCKNISQMFEDCKSLESIDMIKWDMSNIQDDGIANLFYDCSSLKSIKMNFNNQYYFLEKKREDSEEIKEKKETKEKNDLICFKENLEGELMREETPSNDDIFRGLPKKGIFIWRKGTNCKELLKLMPPLWNKMSE